MKSARTIVVSDRVIDGERIDEAGPKAADILTRAGYECSQPVHVREGQMELRASLRAAIDEGARVIVTLGGTGTREGNYTPEVSAEFCEIRLHGLETQILLRGLESTDRAGLSRGMVGLTQRGDDGALIVNAPNTPGGVDDALGVVVPLLRHIFEDR